MFIELSAVTEVSFSPYTFTVLMNINVFNPLINISRAILTVSIQLSFKACIDVLGKTDLEATELSWSPRYWKQYLDQSPRSFKGESVERLDLDSSSLHFTSFYYFFCTMENKEGRDVLWGIYFAQTTVDVII